VSNTNIVWIGIATLSAACASPSGRTTDQRATVPVVTAAAELTELASSVEAGGIVRPRMTALVASRVMAPIVDVRVRAGDRVRRDDVLVILDSRDLRADDARAKAAAIAAAESVNAAEADVRAGETAVTLARLTHERMAALQAKRSATTAELDQAAAADAAAEAQHAAAQSRLAAAGAARDAASAAAAATAVTVTYATLTAPFDGIVTERSAEPGSMATPGSPLLTLEDPTPYRLEATLDESRAAHVSRGDEVKVRLDTEPTSISGRVVEIARVDPSSHSFRVKIDLPAGFAVRSGQFGRASFSGPARRAVTIPSLALVRRGQLTFVFVAETDHRVRLRAVSTGDAAGDRTEVLAGLREGERVVTSPAASLSDGDAISGARP
jgi:HlyD family secretion protein